MGMLATGGDAEPPRWVRVTFTFLTAILAIALLIAGGLTALQAAAIATALPFSIVMLGICWATVLAFQREMRAYERARRAQFVDHIGDYYGLEVESRNDSGIRFLPAWLGGRKRGKDAAPPTTALEALESEAAAEDPPPPPV